MQCPHCGAEVPAGNTFCQRCRKRVVGAGGSLQRPGWVTLLAVLAFLGALLSLALSVSTASQIVSPAANRYPLSMWTLAAFYLGVGLLYLFEGFGLWRLRPWLRYLQIVLAFLGSVPYPVGTIISLLLLVYVFRPGTRILFSGRDPSELSPDEWEQVRRASRGTGLFIVITLLLLLVVFFVGGGIVVPTLAHARIVRNDRAARSRLREIVSAEVAYAAANGGLYDRPSCLMEPVACIPTYFGQPLLDSALSVSDTWQGYQFLFFAGPRPEAGTVDATRVSKTSLKSFVVVARPVRPGSSGVRTYCAAAAGAMCELDAVNERELSQGVCPAACRPLP
jgi:hypothetical protein